MIVTLQEVSSISVTTTNRVWPNLGEHGKRQLQGMRSTKPAVFFCKVDLSSTGTPDWGCFLEFIMPDSVATQNIASVANMTADGTYRMAPAITWLTMAGSTNSPILLPLHLVGDGLQIRWLENSGTGSITTGTVYAVIED